VVLYHSDEQKNIALKIIDNLNGAKIWDDPLVTQLVPFEVFYSAEAYHQDYFDNNTGQMYCKMVIVPKVEKFEKLFKDKLKKK
jgi:peptide methionine sulfoxide reductase MsrA